MHLRPIHSTSRYGVRAVTDHSLVVRLTCIVLVCVFRSGQLWHTKSDELIFCEVAGRTGGGGIPEQILELFTVMLNKTFAQAQAGDKITGPVDENWTKRKPAVAGSVGWVFLYPRVGHRIVSLPKKSVVLSPPLQCIRCCSLTLSFWTVV